MVIAVKDENRRLLNKGRNVGEIGFVLLIIICACSFSVKGVVDIKKVGPWQHKCERAFNFWFISVRANPNERDERVRERQWSHQG